MKVRATARGYYDHVTRSIDEEFEMEDSVYKHTPKDKHGDPLLDKYGKPVVRICSWVVSVEESAPAKKPVGRKAKQSAKSED